MDLIRVLIIAPRGFSGNGIAALLGEHPALAALGVAHSAEETSTAMRTLRPTVVVVDGDALQDGSLEAIEAVLRQFPEVPHVVVTDHQDAETLGNAVHAGARAFLPSSAPTDELVDMVVQVARGGSSVPPHLLSVILDELYGPRSGELAPPLDRLTQRQLEVLTLLADGLDPEAIAARLGLSLHTIRTHVKDILRRLEVHSALEAVTLALRSGVRPHRNA